MTPAASTPRWPRIAAPIAGLWYAFGLSQMILGYLADPAAVPVVIWLAYGAACTLGMIGSAALAFAPGRAAPLYALSLIAAATYFGYTFAFTSAMGGDIGIGATVMAITLGLALVSRRLR